MADISITAASPEDARAIAEVQIATWHSTYRGIVPASFLASMVLDTNEQRWSRILDLDQERPEQRITLAARSATEGIVGFLSAGPERDGAEGYPGEVYALYVAQQLQGRGIGSKLFHEASRQLKNRNLAPFLIWVLSDNPFRRFYEHVGGTELHRKTIRIGDSDLEETAYGFSD